MSNPMADPSLYGKPRPICLYCYYRPEDMAKHLKEDHNLNEKDVRAGVAFYKQKQFRPKS
jgi:hypothetical protein